MESSESASLRTMVARVSPDDIVIYANGAMAAYLNVSKRELVGSPLDVLADRAQGEISSCFARPETGRTSNHLVTDAAGRVFEAKSYSDGGVLDIVFDEVTTAAAIGRELRDTCGTPLEALTEEELRTTRHPESRYLTVSYTQLRGTSAVAERLAPMEVRLMVNSFVEEASDAVIDVGCTIGEASGDAVLGIYGAPRYFADHPLRAIRAACDQVQKAANLHAGLYREGKELPPCSVGLWTGDTLVGTLGSASWQHYTALGVPVELAQKLCNLARPGEVLLPEHTLTHLLRVLPESWEFLRAEGESEPDLSDFQWTGDEVAPLPEALRKIVYLIGPNVQSDTDQVEYYFDYLWAFQVPGRDETIPILRVMRPVLGGDALALSDDNVVTTQIAQTLGKYKLVEVIGIGGMGKVWRAIDRFGNSVAIKVLHSNETVTEAQLKRFRREAEIMAKLPHRNICRVFEMNEFDSIHYIAMEYVDGLALADLLYERTSLESAGHTLDNVDLRALIGSLRSEKPLRDQQEREAAETGEDPKPRPKQTRILPVEQTLSIFLKVCDAVQFAHEHGVLHRDLKPGNILLREDGEPLVADFGLAKLSSPDESNSLSVSGHVVGTLENMSPEQAESSKDVDERADVYSLGTILYQMLTGRRHLEATGNIVSDAQTLQNHEPMRLRVHNPQIDSDLDIITLKALRNNPAERYRSVAALQADLEHYRRGEIISARPVSWVEVTRKAIQRNKGVATVVLASCLIFVIGGLTAIAILSRSLAAERTVNRQLKEQRELNELTVKQLDDRRTAAALAEKNAKIQEKLAQNQKNDAEEARAAALEAEKAAEVAKQELEIQIDKVKKASRDTRVAKKETEEERLRREEVELALAEANERLEKVTANRRPGGPRDRFGDRLAAPERPEDQGNIQELKKAYFESTQILNLELSPYGSLRTDSDGTITAQKLATGINNLSAALLSNRDFAPGWMLKGQFHMALMEYDRAAESFRQTLRAVKVGMFALPPESDPAKLLELATSLADSPGDSSPEAIEAMQTSKDPQSRAAGEVLRSLVEKIRKTSSFSNPVLDRPVYSQEATLLLVEKNGPDTEVFTNTSGTDLVIWGTPELIDLSPLRNTTIQSLSIVGATAIDWPLLQTLPVTTLDLSKCDIASLPIKSGSYSKVLDLRLAATSISDLNFVRYLPNLKALDISDTRVVDLALLRNNRRLTQLNLQGLNPANLRTLLWVPLESLILSPQLVADKASLNTLRGHRTLKILRAPGDPETQLANEFWRRLDTGAYSPTE